MSRKRLTILGSTGSVGTQTLAVVDKFPEQFEVVALAAGRNVDVLAEQAKKYRPEVVSVVDEEAAAKLRGHIDARIEVGEAGAVHVARTPTDLVMSAMVGAAGLAPTCAAIEQGVQVALANKEVLVMAGEFVTQQAHAFGATLLPVDSEHAALHQALGERPISDVKRLLLTASGGPFLDTPIDELRSVTPERAVAHPRWDMGAKISVDSATLLNKGFEVHEARWLFDLPVDKIGIVIHPESIVHGLVEFVDGSMNAQLGVPDMAGPIAYALGWPRRLPDVMDRLDLAKLGQLTFREVDLDKFPALAIALEACRIGGSAPAVLAAADEVAVAAFLEGRIPFTAIPRVLSAALEAHERVPLTSLEVVQACDQEARLHAQREVQELGALRGKV